MSKQDERRGFYRAIHRVLGVLQNSGSVKGCPTCDNEGTLGNGQVCDDCNGWGDRVSSLIHAMRYDDKDTLSEMTANLTAHFCPGDAVSGQKLAAATTALEGIEPEVLVAWTLANASVIIESNPSVLLSEDCVEWAVSLAENIEEARGENFLAMPTTALGEA